MAKVLQNFLIGIGLDTEKYDKGAKNVEGSLSRMRTLVGFTGTAIAGAFGLAGTAAINAGKRVHDFNIEAAKLKTPTEYVHNYGRALAALGGNAEDAIASISSLEERLAEMRAGGTGRFAGDTDLALAGMDIRPLRDAQTGEEFLRELARQLPELNKEQQLRVQQTLGLSDVVMISLREGVEAFDAGIARAGELYGEFGRATDEAREFARSLAEINTRFQGIGETLAEQMLPGFTGLIDSVGALIDRNRDKIDEIASVLGENPTATSLAAGGGAASASGVALRGIGLRGIGTSLTRLGTPGMIAGGGLLAYDSARDWDWADWWQISKDSAQESLRNWTGQNDYSGLPDAPFGSAVPNVAPGSTESLPPAHGNFLPLNVINYHDGYRPGQAVESHASGLITPYESIYGGGEISNTEAAEVSPEIIMLNDYRAQTEKPITPQRINVQNHLEVQMEMDGRAIDARVVDVIERRERDTIDDIYSSVDR